MRNPSDVKYSKNCMYKCEVCYIRAYRWSICVVVESGIITPLLRGAINHTLE
jgi:hypothetical protein